jgi:cbb3-type cytochrome oxidase subunit 3
MEEHIWWQWFSHYWFVVLTIIGSIGVFWKVYRDRQKERDR